MKSITITIPEDLDGRAAAEARRRGISKSELFRLGLAALLPEPQTDPPTDPWHVLAGFGAPGVSAEPGEIDRVIYEA